MHDKKINPLMPPVLEFAASAAVISTVVYFLLVYGWEIVIIFLKTSLLVRIVSVTSIILIVSAVLALISIRQLAAVKNGALTPYRTFYAASSVLVIAVSTAFACFITAGSSLAETGRNPSAELSFQSGIGPFTVIGDGGRIKIWFYEPGSESKKYRILYGRGPDPSGMISTAEESRGGARHEFIPGGISQWTGYVYQIPGLKKDTFAFRTPPPEKGPFRVLCMGDTGNTKRNEGYYSYFGEVMSAARDWYRAAGAEPDFLLHLGDMVKTGSDLRSWMEFFSVLERHPGLPLVPVPGNHEFLEDYAGNFRYFFSIPMFYSFDYGCAHFIIANAYDGPGTSPDGPVLSTGRRQYDFIKRELEKKSGKKWIIVCMHTPVLSTGDYGTNEILTAQYLELFRKHRVDLVLSGHDHNFDAFQVDGETPWGGTFYLVAGTGGSSLDDYIMKRKKNRWLDWRHDRNSPNGLFFNDEYAFKYHLYGELSWGFLDIKISDDAIDLSYQRWLGMDRFLEITGQELYSWNMVPPDEAPALKSVRAETVFKISKKRHFTREGK